MATDQVTIFNLALTAAGINERVASPTEASPEAETCLLWYDVVLDKVLRAAPWPAARTVKRLALIKERDFSANWTAEDPEPNWRFAYAYPTDLIRPQYLVNYQPFTTGRTNSKRSVLTNVASAMLVYTAQSPNIGQWDSGFKMAVIHALASSITMPLTAKNDRVRMNFELANNYILEARLEAANQSDNQLEALPDWIEARGYSQGRTARYIYPHGPVFNMSDFGGGSDS